MTDFVTPEIRSRIMSRIKSKNTSAEVAVRSFLHSCGIRFRIHKVGLPGTPDIVMPKYRALVFVHGCFWHQHKGCSQSRMPLSNQEYWANKLMRNVARDGVHNNQLKMLGWRVFVIWGCEIGPTQLNALVKEIRGEFCDMPSLGGDINHPKLLSSLCSSPINKTPS